MASHTKVDSAGRAAERRAEGSPAGYAPNTSASGTFAARGGSGLVADADLAGEGVAEAEEGSVDATVGEGEAEPEAASGEADLAVPRSSSIEELAGRSTRGPSADDDEHVSLDELLISDSEGDDDDDDDDEATDIHPGLSEALLAEARRSAAQALSLETSSGADELAPEPEPEAETESPEAERVAAAPEVAEEPQAALAGPVAAAELTAAADASAGDGPPTAPDGSPVETLDSAPESEVMEVSPESEAAASASAAAAAEPGEAEAAPEADAPAPSEPPPLDQAAAEEPVGPLELGSRGEPAEPLAAAPPPAERETMPEILAAKRRDAPLPSFDIPDLEAVSAAGSAARIAAAELRSRVTPPRPVPLPPLSEIAEDDDDDAVTHMGLPSVPEAANDFPAASGGFQVADPHVAALQSLDADISRADPRRATTRVIPRVDPKSLPAKPRVHHPAGPPLSERLTAGLRATWSRIQRLAQPDVAEPSVDAELSPARRRLGWMLENVLPPLSLVLFGSGLGAGVIMLVEADRSVDAAAASVQGQAVQALQEAPALKAPLTLAERARVGDGEALNKITNLPQAERTSGLTLALEAGYQAQKLREFKEFAKSVAAGPGPLPAASLSRMVEYATTPETMLPAFQEITQWPGPVGPDVLYAVWEKAGGGSRAASLAQQLLYSADQRAKATPALIVALDLRSAANCDDYLRVLPSAVRDGDQRSGAALRALRHSDGCGADGQQDCYACLRSNPLLEKALDAINSR